MSAGESMENSYNFLIVASPPPQIFLFGGTLKGWNSDEDYSQ